MEEDNSNDFTPIEVLKNELNEETPRNNDNIEEKKIKSFLDDIMINGKELIAILLAFVLAASPWTVQFIMKKINGTISENLEIDKMTTLNWKGVFIQTVIFSLLLAIVKVAVNYNCL